MKDPGTEAALREMTEVLFLTPEQRLPKPLKNFSRGKILASEPNVLTEALRSEITHSKLVLESYTRKDTMKAQSAILRVDIERGTQALAGDSHAEMLEAYNSLVRHYYY